MLQTISVKLLKTDFENVLPYRVLKYAIRLNVVLFFLCVPEAAGTSNLA